MIFSPIILTANSIAIEHIKKRAPLHTGYAPALDRQGSIHQ